MDLFPCPSCARHVRRSALACPFCDADVTAAAAAAPIRAYPRSRMRRAASFAFGAAAIGAAGCSESRTPETDAGPDPALDAWVGADAAVYGGPSTDVPATDAGVPADDDAGTTTTDASSGFDAGLDAGGSVLLYGGPPEP